MLNAWVAVIKKRQCRLLAFFEAQQNLTPRARVYRGIRQVPVDEIRGSVNRRQDFDGNFNPIGEHVRERWQKIYLALSAGQVLPPLQLYKLGSDYFVVDGHHRVSVARQLGIQYLEAEVVEYMLSAA
jgi:hypothetical protein